MAFAFASLCAPERNTCYCTTWGRSKDYFWERDKSHNNSKGYIHFIHKVSEAVKEADPPTCCPEKTTLKDYAISKKTCLYLILLGVIVWTPYSDIRRLNCIGITFFRKIVATNLNKRIFRQVIEECDKRPIIMRNGQK